MGKGSRVMWQMGGAQGIKSVKILLNKSFFPPNLSMFHSYWSFCNLEISTVYIKRRLLLGKRVTFLDSNLVTNIDSMLKSRESTLPAKVCLVKAVVFQVWMWELDHREGWAPKNWWFETVVLEETLESPLDSMEIKPDNPKGNQSWIFIGRTAAEAEAPILWPRDVKSWPTGRGPDAGKDWG